MVFLNVPTSCFAYSMQKHFRSQYQDSDEVQQQILANQKAHLERIKMRAQQARKAAKQHDQSLIDELANQLKDDEY